MDLSQKYGQSFVDGQKQQPVLRGLVRDRQRGRSGPKTNKLMGSLVDRAGGKINVAGTNTGKIIADRAGTGVRGGELKPRARPPIGAS